MTEYQVTVSMNGKFFFRTDWESFKFQPDAHKAAKQFVEMLGFGAEARVYSRVSTQTLKADFLGEVK
jgi:hypothetical protein